MQITDPYIRWLQRALEAYTGLLREEALRIRNGLVREGTLAGETLDILSKLTPQAPPSSAAPGSQTTPTK